MTCYHKKKKFKSEFEATVWYQVRFNDPYYVYECPYDENIFHISTKGYCKSLQRQLAKAFNPKTSKFIGRVKGNNKSIWDIEFNNKTYRCLYYKKSKRVEILKEV